MNDDDRLSRYLSERAGSITLTPADPAAVMRRGALRRNRRRGAVLGTVAVLGVVATSVAVYDDGSKQKVDVNYASPDVAASTFDWNVVSPDTGLGYSGSHAQLANGVVYGLSTAPGPSTETTYNQPATLYRSDDGVEWAEVDLPSGLSASSLAANGDTLYALGTAPAGGGTRDLVVAASTDGAATWSSIPLPREFAELEARHPDEVALGSPRIAAMDSTHMVATVVVMANLDAMKYRPELAGYEGGWEWTADGLTVYEPPAPCEGLTEATTPGDKAGLEGAAEACRANAPTPSGGQSAVRATYTYDELGVDPELRDLGTGQIYAYASDDGSTFQRTALPADTAGWVPQLLAGADGYRLIVGSGTNDAPTTTILRSIDGHTWEVADTVNGSPMDAGYLGDRLAIAVYVPGGSTVVQVQQSDGSWIQLDVGLAVTPPADGEQVWVNTVAFGPLGLAAVVGTADEDGNGTEFLVHSSDGTQLSVLAIEDTVGDTNLGDVTGVSVDADAITVRISQHHEEFSDVPTQVVLVGTPAG